MPVSLTLSELAEKFSLQYKGNGDTLIDGIGTLTDATSRQVSFLANPTYREQLTSTRAAAVIVSADEAGNCPVNVLLSDDPYVSYAKIANCFDPSGPVESGIHPSAQIDSTTTLANNVHVGANAVIGPGCEIEDACFIGPGCVLVADCKVGSGCRLVANITICGGVVIGKRTVIHPGAVIGADGFGMAFEEDHWIKVPQLGSVQVGDDCEIGANTTIDRGAIGDTMLGNDVRLDNQIQIGHNVSIGAHTAMAGRVGISGSTRIGEYCMFAGSSGAVGHIRIADHTTVNFCTVVTKSITDPGTVWSAALPARPSREWSRSVAGLRQLEKLIRRVLQLEKKAGIKQKND